MRYQESPELRSVLRSLEMRFCEIGSRARNEQSWNAFSESQTTRRSNIELERDSKTVRQPIVSVYVLLWGPRPERIKLEATRSCKICFERTEFCSHQKTFFMIELYKIRFDEMRFHFKNPLRELYFWISFDARAFWVKITAKSKLGCTWLMEVNSSWWFQWWEVQKYIQTIHKTTIDFSLQSKREGISAKPIRNKQKKNYR